MFCDAIRAVETDFDQFIYSTSILGIIEAMPRVGGQLKSYAMSKMQDVEARVGRSIMLLAHKANVLRPLVRATSANEMHKCR